MTQAFRYTSVVSTVSICIIRQIGYCIGVTLRIRYWVWSTFDLGKAKGIQLKDSTRMFSVRTYE